MPVVDNIVVASTGSCSVVRSLVEGMGLPNGVKAPSPLGCTVAGGTPYTSLIVAFPLQKVVVVAMVALADMVVDVGKMVVVARLVVVGIVVVVAA